MQRYFAKNRQQNCFDLSDNDLYHIKKVMRMNDKDKIEVVYNKELYLCELDNGCAKILRKEDTLLTSRPHITLVITLLKEQKMDLILQKSTELGVDEIIPVIMKHSIIKLEESKQEKKIERWQKICKEASEQSKRLDIPVVHNVCQIDDLKSLEGVKLTCSTIEKSQNLKNYLKNVKNYDRIILVIGPEGGLAKEEESYLREIGFTSVSLGNRIMRVETVPLFLLSVLSYETME